MSQAKRYIENLLSQYSSRNVNAFIDTAAEDISSIYLSKMELEEDSQDHASLSDEIEEESMEGEGTIGDEEEQAEPQLASITSVIADECRLVVLGNPGSGKTTVLIHELISLCRSFLEGKSSILPIFISLKEMREDYTLSDVMAEVLGSDELADYVIKGDGILFLDGLNEVQPGLYDSTIQDIKDLLSAFPLLRLVVTSRKYGYSNQLDIPQYEIQAFGESEIMEYIQHRTGSLALFNVLKSKNLLYSLASTPLMLKMITDIWKASNRLPSRFSTLYKEFISYQLSKSLSLTEEDKDCLLDVFAHLAFELRDTGFIADSVEHLRYIISSYVTDDKCDALADKLLKSGLLAINSLGHGFDYVSFIHETFQEYFCSLYIAQNYLRTHELMVDATNSKWKETVKLSLEMILPHLSKQETGALLDFLRRAFYRKSSNRLVDEHLEEFVALFRNIIDQSDLAMRYVEHYVCMNMNNYIGSKHLSDNVGLFHIIVNSILKLPSFYLMQTLFEDKSWLNQWLLGEDDLTGKVHANRHQELVRKRKFKILLRAISKSLSTKACFLEILQDFEHYAYSYVLGKRLRYMLSYAVRFLTQEDLKDIYLKSGKMLCLLLTMDEELIKQELSKPGASLADIEGPYQILVGSKYSSTKDLKALNFYYNYIVPRYEDELFDTKQLRRDIIDCQGLLDRMLDETYWREHFSFLAKIVYVLPEEYWSEKYNQYISELSATRNPFLSTMNTSVEKNADLKCYLNLGELCYYSFGSNKRNIANDIAESILRDRGVHVVIKNIGRLELLEKVGPIENNYDWRCDLFDDLRSEFNLISIQEENGHSVLYFELTEKEGANFARKRILLGNGVYTVKRTRNLSIVTSLQLDSCEYIHHIKSHAVKKEGLMASYYLFHRSVLLEYIHLLVSFATEDLAHWGILGYFPKKLEDLVAKGKCRLYEVLGKDDHGYMLKVTTGKEILRLSISEYDIWEEGDLILYYQNHYFKIQGAHDEVKHALI